MGSTAFSADHSSSTALHDRGMSPDSQRVIACTCPTHRPSCVIDLLRVMAETRGFFSRADALAAGMDDRSIRRAIAQKHWHRVRNGAYTMADLWPSDPLQQHTIMVRAVATKLGDVVAPSHTSAAVLHGLSLWQPDLRLVHVT